MNYAHEMPALTAEDIVKSRLHLIVKDLFKEVLKRTTELIDAEKKFHQAHYAMEQIVIGKHKKI